VFVVDSSTPESVKVGHVAEIIKMYCSLLFLSCIIFSVLSM
jgi:hypothetical protein